MNETEFVGCFAEFKPLPLALDKILRRCVFAAPSEANPLLRVGSRLYSRKPHSRRKYRQIRVGWNNGCRKGMPLPIEITVKALTFAWDCRLRKINGGPSTPDHPEIQGQNPSLANRPASAPEPVAQMVA